jgi:hypothetical protein
MRAKTAYELEKDENGKVLPVKKGMAPEQRAGLEYEFTVVLDMDNTRHTATAGKDRTRLFDGQCFVPDETIGNTLMQWLNTGVEAPPNYYQPVIQQPTFADQFAAQTPQFHPATFEQPLQQPVFEQPIAPAVPPAPIYGFPAYEPQIIANMTATWGNLEEFGVEGIVNYIQQRYNRPPAGLTVDECDALAKEFASYAQQKGGQ